VQLVLKSIGYKSLPLDGVPFDSKQGVVPNAAGRVLTGGWWGQTTLAVVLDCMHTCHQPAGPLVERMYLAGIQPTGREQDQRASMHMCGTLASHLCVSFVALTG
jgi:hypothetical protein